MKQCLALTMSFLMAAAVLSLAPVWGEADIYDDVLRLRVIAASDSDEDQSLKLQVRDAVLECLAEALDECRSVEDAIRTVDRMQKQIQSAAEECVHANGSDCTVTVTRLEERFPRREYGSATLPAGVYPSLHVTLGDGAGHNWWCVLFPTVCVRFADADADAYLEAGFTPEEYRIITGGEGKVRVRFRVLEVLAELLETREKRKK